ncbi:glutathione S-transferase family protein [Xanthobacter dioxanivorans]|uniref:Glutathione S-transferase family protein n=1 Tax=Xanthobacter dioxanivorans TaxID=2528964 RepID=A0A974PPC5_9HYPH|nr:glutathione S-transferase family protein [Xanthobacter dioxanivorans]QRG06996.1 glutathione S-transferase family protein [Xanthobacter dioxanivorans]
MLKIWGRLNSVNVEKVVWCALELGLPFERIDAGGAFGVVGTPEFRAMNPCGRVPVIEDDGFVLWESNAIVRYLAARHGSGTLMPLDPHARADAERWMDFQLGTVAPLLSPVFRGLVRTAPEARDMTSIARAFDELKEVFVVADGALVGRTHLVGDRFTMADIPLGAAAHRWFNLPLDGLPLERPPLPRLAAWHGRLKLRPAAAQLMTTPLT